MPLTGTFQTPNAAKYLGQLCKHFGHKIEVEYTETEGTAHFIFGPAHFRADDTTLTVQFDLLHDAATDSAKGVIDSHLERFAFREDFKNMNWSA
ncbi:DUF2218 domain-containing protein [Sulfitobacter sp. M57]|uniref:DUF2218 domain-containing protein n=1 Tax=unclassified Sulfitobacter TaxID=196795 RepID=UPI0023E31A4F|nr:MULTISPECIES: DUF2218 domain-containing protein [unclassified Sulfitobacter]MDF3415093.1 DUF2218 domain-containing protein [Sulfitobacter sp. KE5]MDF3422574.1 DUF2218 domain-containing protein [Sulfitobacter sp. KE43]MDF3433639.1 DUF2218 domain-containing protein [Sulfitobacter sp. KE42]MDF3459279.1 DUF2218 domain-containing protein [Sulfitobacter sp. S74]MDF3463178.1 DUF2218 domain-containing protein [Sulfitobacter sp. Ks18]